jgi:hypothetical protein
MAVGTEIVNPLAPPKIPGPFPMDACLPVPVHIPVTLAAEPVTFGEIDELAVVQAEFIPVFCIMAIEAPSKVFTMMEDDIRMLVFQFPLFPIDFQRSMTVAAGEHSLCQRRWHDRKLLLRPRHNGDKGHAKQKDNGEGKACFSHMGLNGVAGRKEGTHDPIPDAPFAKPTGPPMEPGDFYYGIIPNFSNIFNNKKQNNLGG